MNPFADWTPDQQTFGVFAEDFYRESVSPDDTRACRWCALGWLDRVNATDDDVHDFDHYLIDSLGGNILNMNDTRQWTPTQFREAWDRFEESRAK